MQVPPHRGVAPETPPRPELVADAGLFHLDDLGPEFSKETTCVRRSDKVPQFQHPVPGQRTFRLGGGCSGHGSSPHRLLALPLPLAAGPAEVLVRVLRAEVLLSEAPLPSFRAGVVTPRLRFPLAVPVAGWAPHPSGEGSGPATAGPRPGLRPLRLPVHEPPDTNSFVYVC